MRMIPSTLAQHLAGEVTTLARCWRLTRRDGTVLGFTDHDRDLIYGGVTHEAASGLDPSEVESELGFGVSGGDVSGALNSARISAEDIAQGLYDGAELATDLVNWSDPEQRIRLSLHLIGEVKRSERGFVAELRSASVLHDAEHGRVYSRDCSADLGDAQCGVAVPAVTATVVATDGRLFLRVAITAADGDYTRGVLHFTSGANAGPARAIRLHRQSGNEAEIMLWQGTAAVIAAGDVLTLKAGCDKSFRTCRNRFNNGARFRGFPHMPGNDFILGGVASGTVLDGRSLFR